ncbi:hypothetical protein MHK13_01280 [Corynebacterium hadale]|uniref:hypothetical protein n=1 Tax=Corynebacterium hadale TaxID=2026255 RepID=UPI001EF1B983|nr:hypothetical protein [Corynebacterium hadale]MCG7253375.1 hypothetical protein [Corynebacterium hadale]MCG7255623.1 hypothetical protein [Corynebacterium hadale]MCG7264800.1 hypothetical protein [Corynebacterium hadale]
MTTPENAQSKSGQRAQKLIDADAPNNELQQLIDELEETTSVLRTELEMRRKTDHERLTPEQLEELNRIPEYLEMTRPRWRDVLTFFREFRDEANKKHQ